jgi:hypothetical protein
MKKHYRFLLPPCRFTRGRWLSPVTRVKGKRLVIEQDGRRALVLCAAIAARVQADIIAELLSSVRKWHGSIIEQFEMIDNFLAVVARHKEWPVPADLMAELTASRAKIQELINKCLSSSRSPADRQARNSLLKYAVGLCLLQGRAWAYEMYATGEMTGDDVHVLGFLLPGEHGGHHDRVEPTAAKPVVKVAVIGADRVRVQLDQSAGENAALVKRGWPPGVKYAEISILSADEKKEVYRHTTTRLRNDIFLPDGSHGKQFLVKAAFLTHVDDRPDFADGPTFSMPLTTEDLINAVEHHHHQDFEEHMREVELHRLDIERLQAELAALKKQQA